MKHITHYLESLVSEVAHLWKRGDSWGPWAFRGNALCRRVRVLAVRSQPLLMGLIVSVLEMHYIASSATEYLLACRALPPLLRVTSLAIAWRLNPKTIARLILCEV